MSKYIIHKAVEFDAVKVGVRKEMGVSTVSDLADRYMAQRKYDGCNAIVIVTPNREGDKVLSRTGEVVRSCQHFIVAVRQKLARWLEKGFSFAVLGEAWRPGTTQNIISGEFRQHDPAPKLQFMVFDRLSVGDFEAGASDEPCADRSDACHYMFRPSHALDTVQLVETYNPGTYGDPIVMANALVASGGFDGLILRDPEAGWAAGSGTGGEIIKVKPTETYDLRVIGAEEGKGKYADMLGALICKGKNGPVKVGGMTDEQRREWWDASITGAIVEVECLGLTPSGSLREPRFKGIRYDKESADFE
ncbi:hypothetical protein ACQUFY_05940 [Robbsia andropogonis]|uniref:hypothetical protein n=1 Tax=Robbsia andropogonis TaxID=28092 RepID=UPI003D1AA56D